MSGSYIAHNRHDALALASRALSRYAAGTQLALRQFDSALRNSLATAERELASREAELRAALAALAAADEDSAAAARARVARAEEQVRLAERAVQAIRAVVDRFRGRAQGFVGLSNDTTLRGQAQLRTLDSDLDRYLAAGAGGLGSGSGGSRPSAVSTTAPLGSVFAQRGLEEVPVAAVDFSSNPVISWGHASRPDVEWAVDRWAEVVSKVAARGGSRDELAARDERDGTVGTMRQLANVWDMFLGDDPITLSEASDGALEVTDGRHRLLVASEIGIKHLPARIIRRSDT